jgi:hypothetical protein
MSNNKIKKTVQQKVWKENSKSRTKDIDSQQNSQNFQNYEKKKYPQISKDQLHVFSYFQINNVKSEKIHLLADLPQLQAAAILHHHKEIMRSLNINIIATEPQLRSLISALNESPFRDFKDILASCGPGTQHVLFKINLYQVILLDSVFIHSHLVGQIVQTLQDLGNSLRVFIIQNKNYRPCFFAKIEKKFY